MIIEYRESLYLTERQKDDKYRNQVAERQLDATALRNYGKKY